MQRQTRVPLFNSLSVNVAAIREEFDYLTDDQCKEVAETFASYIDSPDAFDLVRDIALDVWSRD